MVLHIYIYIYIHIHIYIYIERERERERETKARSAAQPWSALRILHAYGFGLHPDIVFQGLRSKLSRKFDPQDLSL